MSIEIGSSGINKLRTRVERCDICRHNPAEAKIVVGVYALVGSAIKEQNLLVCGECAHTGYVNLEMALERTTFEMKQSFEVAA